MADIVLPATMFLEHDDIYQAGGHSSIQIGKKLFEPYQQCRTNHQVIGDLARRLGAPAHPGFEMSEWALIEALLARSGWPDADSIDKAGGWDALPDADVAHYRKGFPTESGKFQFAPNWRALGPDHAVMPRLPDHMTLIDHADQEHPFRLVTAPARQYLNTSFTETPTSIAKEERPTVLVHPEDAKTLGIEPGALVRLGNRQGSVLLHAELALGHQRGVAIVESIWPGHAFIEGVGVNALTSADPGPPNGGAVFHDTAIWMRPEPLSPSRLEPQQASEPIPA
jgi:anaerobic selenocysteine-containing dehydrogenase